MRRFSLLLSTLMIISLLLVACGSEETSTAVPTTNVPPITAESTSTGEATSETPDVDLTTTPAVPVTGENDSSRLSNLLDFDVWNQNGEQVGEVDDMVLDLDNSNIAYVIIGTGGFLDLGEKDILIPWTSLELQTTATGGQADGFILTADPEMLSNFPDFDLSTSLPAMGQPADDWDVDIRNFWEGGVVPDATQSTNTPATGAGTASPDSTATSTTGDTGVATATSSAGTGTTGTGTTGTGQASQLQGVMLASELLGSSLTIGNQGGEGQGLGQATAMPDATATTDSATTAVPDTTATASTGTGAGTGTGTGGPTSATIEDAIVDPDTGDILFLVLNSLFDDGERWIPVPLSTLRWDMTNESFLFVANANALQNAPFFEADQFPDTSTEGWDTDFESFWQSNAGTGDGTGTGTGVATATP